MKRMPVFALCLAILVGLIPVAKAAELPHAGLNYDQYPALRDVYQDYFLVGTIDRFDDTRMKFIDYTYDAITFENSMKPSSTQNTRGNFTLNSIRATLEEATDNIRDVKMIGHTLAWHSQSPNWMWDAPGFDHDIALANLNAHIDRVLGEFGGQLQAVDVVNEAIGSVDALNPDDWKGALDKGEGWVLALGWEWVELAFLRAAQVVDENGWDCKLYYNDVGLDGPKAQAVYAMVKDINERYNGQRPNGRPLIEGIGIQGHFNMSSNMKNIEDGVALLATLPGISISFTEVDVEFLNVGELTQEQAVNQAQIYARLFQICKKYASGTANTSGNPKVIERVTFWGSDDGGSWKSAGLPMLFNKPDSDGQITAKEALLGVLWPDEYLEQYPWTDEEDSADDYHIPGVYVFSLSRGDIWSGANIILGNDASKWPWATTDEDGELAFEPEKDTTYRLSVNYTALGTAGIRIRWITDNTNGGYTSMDSQVVSSPPYSTSLSPNDVATMVPAVFNSGMINAGTYTLITEITLDGSLPADDLIGNLAIRGVLGGNAYEINWIKMEKVDGDVLFVWDPTAPPPEPTPEPEQSTTTSEETASPNMTASPVPYNTDDTADSTDGNNMVFITVVLLVVLAVAITCFVLFRRKSR